MTLPFISLAPVASGNLGLRSPAHGDLEAWTAIRADPEVQAFLGPGNSGPDSAALDLGRHVAQATAGRGSLFVIYTSLDKKPRGYCGAISTPSPDGHLDPEVVIAIHPHHRHGHLASQALPLLFRAIWDAGYDRACGYVDPSNSKSLGLVEKVGMRSLGECIRNGSKQLWYVATKVECGA
jgi:RimJ/RimL family protein N-acetyltransferase